MSALGKVAPSLAVAVATKLFFTTRRFPPRAGELDVLSGARRLRVAGPRGELQGHSWGASGDPPVLLVHGWNGRATQLGAMVSPLLASGHRVLAFDIGGHGASYGRSANLVTFADDLLSLDEAFGPFRAVVTHSFGGAACTVAIVAGLRAERLVYIAPPLSAGYVVDQVGIAFGLDDRVHAKFRRSIERRVGLRLDEVDGRHLGAHMSRPLLVIHDEQDRDVAWEHAETLAASWPGARFVKTVGLGHQRILSDATVLRTAIDFIQPPTPNEEN